MILPKQTISLGDQRSKKMRTRERPRHSIISSKEIAITCKFISFFFSTDATDCFHKASMKMNFNFVTVKLEQKGSNDSEG